MLDRYQEILQAAKDVTFSKRTAQKLVGGQRRLKTTPAQNGRWECNAADVLRHTVLTTKYASVC